MSSPLRLPANLIFLRRKHKILETLREHLPPPSNPLPVPPYMVNPTTDSRGESANNWAVSEPVYLRTLCRMKQASILRIY
jgi:hypothetical protein